MIKTGETYNGHMVATDNWMNITLKQVILTASSGDAFQKIPEIYIRGNTIKYIRVPEDVIVKIRDEQFTTRKHHDSKRGGMRGSAKGSDNVNSNNSQRGGISQRGNGNSQRGKKASKD